MSVRGYWPDEQRHQMRERARRMRAARSSWLSPVEDIIFEHERRGVASIPFSGDARPIDQKPSEQESLG